MKKVLHGRARTTEEVRQAIQQSKESIRALSNRFGVNPKTIAKWRKRSFVHDARMGPKEGHSAVLTPDEEEIIYSFRLFTLLPLDACLSALKPMMKHLTRSSLHRCLQRRGFYEWIKSYKVKNFKGEPIGHFNFVWVNIPIEKGTHYLFIAVDRASKFVYFELHERNDQDIIALFLRNLMKAVPYKIDTLALAGGEIVCRNLGKWNDNDPEEKKADHELATNLIAYNLTWRDPETSEGVSDDPNTD